MPHAFSARASKSAKCKQDEMATKRIWKTFLCLFAQDHPDFRVQELQALVSGAGSEMRYDPTTYSNKNPHLVIQLESEAVAKHVLSRSVLLRTILELWGWGQDYTELESSIFTNISKEAMEPYTRNDYTFKVIASGFGRKCSAERQQMIFKKLAFLPFNGTVNLNSPRHVFYVLEDYGDNPNSAPLEPVRVFFGRLIGHGQRDLINRYSVKNRHFIGSTSMDAQLAFIMANQAKVAPGDLVLDPFAGTGGTLVPSAHFGGYVLGSDIGWKTVHGKGYTSRAQAPSKERGQDENVRANLCQYGLERSYLDMLVADAAICMWRRQELFDAIITDPPYGIREGGRKIGSKSKDPKPIPPECLEGHVPEVQTYKLSELFFDLVKFAARFLVMGGRLVYWMPVVMTEVPEFPTHPCLRLVSCSLQPLQRHVGRRLVTMEKCLGWEEHLRQEACAGDVLAGEQERLRSHDNFREKYFSEECV